MVRISWSGIGERIFEAGVDRGVLYVDGSPGVPWIGLKSVNEKQSGGSAQPRYMNGVKISNRMTSEQFEGSLEAYTYPDEFERCDGTYRGENGLKLKQQRRKPFGMAYRTFVGNDVSGLSHAYKIHILYNLKAAPSDRNRNTLTAEAEALSFTWDLTARPERIEGFRPTAHFEVDSRDVPAELLQQLEDILYGTSTTDAVLPTAAELMFLFDSFADSVYDAGSPYTPAFVTYDAGTPATAVTETIDGGAL
jgi:hypothetical protein